MYACLFEAVCDVTTVPSNLNIAADSQESLKLNQTTPPPPQKKKTNKIDKHLALCNSYERHARNDCFSDTYFFVVRAKKER